MPTRRYCWYLYIGFTLVLTGEAVLYESLWIWLRSRPEELPRIDEVNMLNLRLRKTKQETTALQIVSFHRTPQREKHKHGAPKGLRSPQHRKLRFYSPHHRSKKNINTVTPQISMSPSLCSKTKQDLKHIPVSCPVVSEFWKIFWNGMRL